MLIEQINEFESMEHGALVIHVLLQLVIFMTKQKSFKANLRVDNYLLLKYYTRQCTVSTFSLPGPNHLQNLIPKSNISNVF